MRHLPLGLLLLTACQARPPLEPDAQQDDGSSDGGHADAQLQRPDVERLPPGLCGGFDDLHCAPGMICDFHGCATDNVGACVPRPAECPPAMPADVICTCGGQRFGSDCERLRAGNEASTVPLAEPYEIEFACPPDAGPPDASPDASPDAAPDASLVPERCRCGPDEGIVDLEFCSGSEYAFGCQCDLTGWRCDDWIPFDCPGRRCTDGSEVTCCGLPPRCDDDEITTIRLGCWTCVTAAECP
jgi:hypothetical protein